jgi:hypothetical protein
MPNAAAKPLPEAGARHERTLTAVACTPLFGAGAGRDARPTPPSHQLGQHGSCESAPNVHLYIHYPSLYSRVSL